MQKDAGHIFFITDKSLNRIKYLKKIFVPQNKSKKLCSH